MMIDDISFLINHVINDDGVLILINDITDDDNISFLIIDVTNDDNVSIQINDATNDDDVLILFIRRYWFESLKTKYLWSRLYTHVHIFFKLKLIRSLFADFSAYLNN